MSNTPQIRFAGFTDAWEQRKLGDIGETYTGLSGKTKEDFGHGNAAFVTYMNVFSNPIADSAMTESVEIDKKQNEVKYGDVFFTTSSETPDEVGMSSVWLENGENTYLNSFCFGYRPSVEINPFYMAYMLRSDSVRKNIVFLAQGISRYNISKNKMMEISVPSPTLVEQRKIGEYFRNLDTLITLHQRKCDALQRFKKSMLQKMFPKNGESVPEIRFAGFTDAWEQRKLGDHSEIVAGGTPNTGHPEYWNPKEIPWMSSGEINNKVISSTDNMISKIGFSNSSAKWVKEKSVLIALAGQGKTRGTVAISEIPLTTNQSIAAIQPDSFLYYKFLFQNLEGRYNELREVSSGDGTRGGLNKQIISDLEVLAPEIQEQIKIGDFLCDIDTLITLHQRKLETLQKMKKSLLQKMFV